MENLSSELNIQAVGILIAIAASLIFFIKDGSKFLFDYLKEKISFTWELRKRKLELAWKLEEQKLLAKNEKAIKSLTKDIPLVSELIELNHTLKELRQVLNAIRVTIFMYHNGTAKFFKSFSARHQECRDILDDNMDKFKHRPLSPFYSVIAESLKNKNQIQILNENTDLPIIKHYIQVNELKKYIFFQIVIEESAVEVSHKVLNFNDNGVSYVPIGFVAIELDRYSEDIKEETRLFIEAIREKLHYMYKNSPEIFG